MLMKSEKGENFSPRDEQKVAKYFSCWHGISFFTQLLTQSFQSHFHKMSFSAIYYQMCAGVFPQSLSYLFSK